jgi:hypothetical protein
MKNEIGFTQVELEELVSPDIQHWRFRYVNTIQTTNLNKSSQLSPQNDQTARALPLIWARKLASRAHDTFYHEIIEAKPPYSYKDSRKDKQQKTLEAVRERVGLDARSGTQAGYPVNIHDMWYI